MASNFFQNAQNFTVNNAQFVSNPQTFNYNSGSGDWVVFAEIQEGLDILLKASLPQAAHDSSERDPPPRCHPGTRQDYIAQIIQWSLNKKDRIGRMLWMQGPAGVGKSAVAQTVAETLDDKLGAAFFFSRLNSGDDPDCFFTTLAYQLATKITPFGDILDQKIRRDPTLVTKAMTQQFEALIVAPVRELQNKGIDVGELVIIIDGLDECATMESQRNIIEIVATSVQEQSTPFLWIFFSRPEPHIITVFTSSRLLSLSLHLELPVSRDVDNEITQYLTDEMANLRREHGLPLSWPSENDIGTLVKLSAGLFIYTATIIRFIRAYDSLGPEDQLRLVLSLAKKSNEVRTTHPLFELDSLYMLIMQRVPSQVLLTTQKILILTSVGSRNDAKMAANILNLSESQLQYAYRSLHSVLNLACSNEEAPQNSELRALTLTFYHASFMEFLWDPRRSGKFCLRLECATTLRSDLLGKVNEIHKNSKREFKLIWYWTVPTCCGRQFSLG
ncbi:hypothetical protein P691DRAFT_667702 [Macrolepiota fuliginosa MF-IS2]|uniref:Nephrocystin 3-like N-terminal domain-containing protein n=1 Tax=Macrolepiota fuliginosa MF-IS2 TaxID=1400762 RepID=A0A9P6C505_9AGAR|nr:hypothetical protein P691DRAFT_667702 [Macrolepiota fuliginosa MF-IS2]